MMLVNASPGQKSPPVNFIDGEGGVLAASNFDHSGLKPANPGDVNAGVFSTLTSNEQAQADLSNLDPDTEYVLSGTIYSGGIGFAIQFAVLNGSTSIAAIVLSSLAPFSLQFTTPSNTSGITMHVSGNGSQVGILDLNIVKPN